LCKFCPIWWSDESIKCIRKEATRAASLEKKMNNQPQNDVVLARCILVLRFLMSVSYIPDWLQTFNFFQFSPNKLQFQHLFHKGPWSWIYRIWSLIDQLNFQFSTISPWFQSIGSLEFSVFSKMIIGCEVLAMLPLIWIIWLGKK